MSLRLRLTLLTTLLIIIATAALGIAIYVTAERVQLAQVDENLFAEISEVRVKSLQDNPRPPQDDVYIDTALGRVNRDGVTILPLRAAGTLSNPIPLPLLSPEEIAAASQSPITVNDGLDFRVAVRSHGAGLATVVAATPLTDVEANLSLLARAIVIFGGLVAAVGAVASWLLVRRAFRPMAVMIDEASAIAAGSMDHRLPDARSGTEIGDLTAAMNTMIDSLAAAVTRVERSEDHLRAFVSDASHEIRTPLTVIRGYSELLARSAADRDPLEARALERIEAESRRLDRLVTRLLTLERSTAPRREAHERVDLAVLAQECADDLRVLDPVRDISVTVNLGTTVAEEPAIVLADPDALRQLLSNATQNILRHTPPGSPVTITITTTGRSAEVTIDDAGSGLTVEQKTSSQRGASSSSDGFGLGLTIMQTIATQSGGELHLETSPPGGLRVRLVLPLSPAGSRR